MYFQVLFMTWLWNRRKQRERLQNGWGPGMDKVKGINIRGNYK